MNVLLRWVGEEEVRLSIVLELSSVEYYAAAAATAVATDS